MNTQPIIHQCQCDYCNYLRKPKKEVIVQTLSERGKKAFEFLQLGIGK